MAAHWIIDYDEKEMLRKHIEIYEEREIANLALQNNICRPVGLRNEDCCNLNDVLAAHPTDHFGNEDFQCSSSVATQRIDERASAVWPVIWRFDKPETHKPFISSCSVKRDVKIGCVRGVKVVTGLPSDSGRGEAHSQFKSVGRRAPPS